MTLSLGAEELLQTSRSTVIALFHLSFINLLAVYIVARAFPIHERSMSPPGGAHTSYEAQELSGDRGTCRACGAARI